jgi:hypothetical protein
VAIGHPVTSDPERNGGTSPGSGDFAARLPPYGRP